MSGYTNSPLGLININGFKYKKDSSGGYESIFTSNTYDEVTKTTTKQIIRDGGSGLAPTLGKTPHQNQVYDVSTNNIIKQLSASPHLSLTFADFAYLKDFGVYPNNRLVVCRRFPNPAIDDIYSVSDIDKPISTLISYVVDENFPIKITVNENWEPSDASFRTILNEMGEDFKFDKQFQLGDILEGAVNILPTPGATFLFQRKVMEGLGIIKPPGSAAVIPQGDPNLIKESQRRSLVDEDSRGSGLTGKFTITVKTTYEQKFINGVDPTVVFMDIINNALNMGTSPAVFYLGQQVDAKKNAQDFIDRFIKDPVKVIGDFLKSMIAAVGAQLKQLAATLVSTVAAAVTDPAQAITDLINGALSYSAEFLKAKYKVKFLGIITTLTGAPSTPWHITIGNPLRPIFCSGDMLCTSVNIGFGSQLSFNDLPTFIEVEASFTSARNLGLQEIFAKFNAGGIRVKKGKYVGQYTTGVKHFWNYDELSPTIAATPSTPPKTSQQAQSTDNTGVTNNIPAQTNIQQTTVQPVGATNSVVPAQAGSEVNCDPNSTEPVVDAGSTAQSAQLKDDNQQNTTGSTAGQSNQLTKTDDVPNSGQNAPASPQENNTKPNWIPGEVVQSGTELPERWTGKGPPPFINWTVKKGPQEGIYVGTLTELDGSLYEVQYKDLNYTVRHIRAAAESELDYF